MQSSGRGGLRAVWAVAAVCFAVLRAVECRNWSIDHSIGGTIKIGALFPFQHFAEFNATVTLLARDINNHTIYPDVLPNSTLVYEIADPLDIPQGHVAALKANELIDGGCAALLGPLRPGDQTVATAYVSTVRQVNVLDAFSSSTVLSDRVAFPFYSRTMLELRGEARMLISFVLSLGWTRLGVFVGIEQQNSEMLSLVSAEADARGVEILPPVQFPLSDAASAKTMSVYIELLRASDARVILYLVPKANSLPVMDYLRAAGMFEDQYSYIITSTSFFDIKMIATYPETRFFGCAGMISSQTLDIDISQRARAAWVDRMSWELLGEAYGDRDVNSFPYDFIRTQRMYDASLFLVRAIDALVDLKRTCDADPAAAGCDTLAAEASDDVTLRRLLRATTQSGPYTFPIVLSAEGERVQTRKVFQFNNPDGRHRPPGKPIIEYPQTPLAVWNSTNDSFSYLRPAGWQTASVPLDRAVIRYEPRLVSDGVYGALSALATLGVIGCVAAAVATVRHRAEPIMRMSSWRVNLVTMAGGVVLLSFVFLGKLVRAPAVCSAQLWVATLGFTLLFGPLLAKIWRVYRIFNEKVMTTVVVTDAQLLRGVVLLAALDAFVLALWDGLAPQRVEVLQNFLPVVEDDANHLLVEQALGCTSDLEVPFYAVVISFKCLLLVFGSVAACKTRKVRIKALNDSKWVGLSVYTTTLVASMALPIVFLVGHENLDAAYALTAGPAVLIVLSTVSLMTVPKFWAIHSGTAQRWVTNTPRESSMAAAAVKDQAAGFRRLSPRSAGNAAAANRMYSSNTNNMSVSGSSAGSPPGSLMTPVAPGFPKPAGGGGWSRTVTTSVSGTNPSTSERVPDKVVVGADPGAIAEDPAEEEVGSETVIPGSTVGTATVSNNVDYESSSSSQSGDGLPLRQVEESSGGGVCAAPVPDLEAAAGPGQRDDDEHEEVPGEDGGLHV